MATQALPQFYIADTPEVQAAKAQFAAAWNAAAQRNAVPVAPIHNVAPVAPVAPTARVAPAFNAAPVVAGNYEDGQTWPEAVPYVHEEIAAEPYVHQEPALNEAVAAPVVAPTFNAAPVAPIAPVAPVQGGCYNWKGEGVPCRTQF